MTRGRFRYDPETQKVIPYAEWAAKYGYGDENRSDTIAAPQVINPLQPYKSMITGEMITDRAQHREHLKRHGREEVGNDYHFESEKPKKPPAGPDVKRALEELRSGKSMPKDDVLTDHKPEEGLDVHNVRIY